VEVIHTQEDIQAEVVIHIQEEDIQVEVEIVIIKYFLRILKYSRTLNNLEGFV
jgi:hypothetical protein